jgi:hypothetical protein
MREFWNSQTNKSKLKNTDLTGTTGEKLCIVPARTELPILLALLVPLNLFETIGLETEESSGD